MPQITKAQQTINAQVLRDETVEEANTALRVYDLLKNIIDSAVFYDQIVQIPGNSTTTVMSQKAITDALAAILGGVPSAGDTLAKLYNLISDIGTLVGGWNSSILPTNGSDPSGAINKGDYWKITGTITIAGIGDLKIGDTLVASIADASVAADFFALQNNVDQATSSVFGLVKLYTDVTGTNTDGAVSQAAVKTAMDTLTSAIAAKWTAVDASETVKGYSELATDAETVTGTDTTRTITPSRLTAWWGAIKAAAVAFTNTLSATDITATNQSGTGYRMAIFDSTGKIIRYVNGHIDPTTGEVEFHGLDDLDTTDTFAIYNQSGQLQLKVTNGFRSEFGHDGSSIIEVPTGVNSGNAELHVNANQAIAYRWKDKSSNQYLIMRSTTGDLAWTFLKKVEYDYGQGFKKVHWQIAVVTSITNSAWNNIITIPIAANRAMSIEVHHLFAYATDASVACAYGDMNGYAKRDGSNNTTVGAPTPTMRGTVSTSWRIAADDTNEEVEIDFQNSASGKTWTVMLDFTTITSELPI